MAADINKLILDIRQWGYDKGILLDKYSDEQWDMLTKKQWDKTVEEVVELYIGIRKGSKMEVSDAIGDVIVTLTMQAELWGIDIGESLADVYRIISARKGKMVDGQFVKETKDDE